MNLEALQHLAAFVFSIVHWPVLIIVLFGIDVTAKSAAGVVGAVAYIQLNNEVIWIGVPKRQKA